MHDNDNDAVVFTLQMIHPVHCTHQLDSFTDGPLLLLPPLQ